MRYRKLAGFRLNTRFNGFAAANKRLSGAPAANRARQWVAIRRAALLTERELKKGIRRGAPGGRRFRPLSLSTKVQRRGRKPLLDTGSLFQSIKTTLDKGRLRAFIGVHRTARQGAFNVAIAHEFGTRPFVIPVTPGVRRFFWYLHFKSNGRIKPLSPSKTQILHPGVPARPFLRPTLEAILPRLSQDLVKTFLSGRGPI